MVGQRLKTHDRLKSGLEASGLGVETYRNAEEFLRAYRTEQSGCLVLDTRLPGMSGLELQAELSRRGIRLPIIFFTAHRCIQTAVCAIKAGAEEFLVKPEDKARLIGCVCKAVMKSMRLNERLASLTRREYEIMAHVIAGRSSKETARLLGISHRTVEVHRTRVLQKLRVRSALKLVEVVRSITKS